MSVITFTHEQNIFCSETRLDGSAHENSIICRQLFAMHLVGSRPIEKVGQNASNDKLFNFMRRRDVYLSGRVDFELWTLRKYNPREDICAPLL